MGHRRHVIISSLAILFIQLVQVLFEAGGRLAILRFITPTMLGEWAFLMIFLNLAVTASRLSTQKAVLLKKKKSDFISWYGVGFTLELVVGMVVAVIFVGVMYLALPYFGYEKLRIFIFPLAGYLLLAKFSYPRVIWMRDLELERSVLPASLGVVANAVVSVGLAVFGGGVWALYGGLVAGSLVDNIVTWWRVETRPRLCWDWRIVRSFIRFGSPLTASGLISFYYWNIDDLIVGAVLGPTALGFYNLAFKIPHIVLRMVQQFSDVTLSWWAKAKSDQQLLGWFGLTTKLTAYVLIPMAVGFVVWGEVLGEVLFGREWLPSILPMKVFMVLIMLRGVYGYWAQLFVLREKTQWLFAISLQNAVVLSLIAWPAVQWYGIVGMAGAVLLTILVSFPYMLYRVYQLFPDISYLKLTKRAWILSSLFVVTATLNVGFELAVLIISSSALMYICLILYFDKQVRTLVVDLLVKVKSFYT